MCMVPIWYGTKVDEGKGVGVRSVQSAGRLWWQLARWAGPPEGRAKGRAEYIDSGGEP